MWHVSTIPICWQDSYADKSACKPQKYWGQYKILGGSYSANGCIHGMQSDATSILQIEPIKINATAFGTVPDCVNKWKEGVLSIVDNYLYAVPANINCVLRVNTDLLSSSYLRID